MPTPSQPHHRALLPPQTGPRLILYAQTHHTPSGQPISLLPLLTNNTGVTHVYIAAIHLNDRAGDITLNDHHPDDARYGQLWGEVAWLQGAGVTVMGMLGGAARGTFERLSGDEASVRRKPNFALSICLNPPTAHAYTYLRRQSRAVKCTERLTKCH